MKMVSFRVQNYKKIEDSGWIACGNLTAFVGKNEAGKSALFRALSKMNPSDNAKYDPLREFPRNRYNEFKKQEDWPVTSVLFELNNEELRELREIYELITQKHRVRCTRYYSGRLDIEFDPALELPEASNASFSALLEGQISRIRDLMSSNGGINQELNQLVEDLVSQLQNIRTIVDQEPESTAESAQVEAARQAFQTTPAELHPHILPSFVAEIDEFGTSVQSASTELAKEMVESYIPKFIYFDRYDVIDSAIHFPSFIDRFNSDPTEPRLRATKCLFEHVGLDIPELIQLDPNRREPQQPEGQTLDTPERRKEADERGIQMASASDQMTRDFSKWWKQRQYKFVYGLDGSYFRIWVSDDLSKSSIELEQRSYGLQYFFSFFVIFLVEAGELHRDAILLLDEPGLHMHGTAQRDVVKFLEAISLDNQTLYTTHSPFMIDGDHLENVRIVSDSEGGVTKVSDEIWPSDKDALFPLQAALDYSIAQTLFFAKRQLLVEGLVDLVIFKAINQVLKERGLQSLRDDIVIVPVGGVRNLMPMAALLHSQDLELAIVLDGDDAARTQGRKISEIFQSMGKQGCLFLGDYVEGNKWAELEDLFPEDFYLEAVEEHYGRKVRLNKSEKATHNITKKIDSIFKKQNKEFEKWYPALKIVNWIAEGKKQVPEETLEVFSRIFSDVNNAFAE
jgi:predicted ATP-dependent endonuclease of OLD family